MTEQRVVEIISSRTGYAKGSYNPEWHLIRKNAMVATTIKILQNENYTEIDVVGNFPTLALSLVMMLLCCTGVGLIIYVVYIFIHFNFQDEIVNFIKNNPEFNPIETP
ncbi:MAG: hypothetical protein KGD59_14905 [Candidatus Heimdallarchaeota archaeon]|nr:hypothetical protein [Candidatus Heimdallarchaeota archaeon]